MISKPQIDSAPRTDPGVAHARHSWCDEFPPGRRVPGSLIYDLAPIGSVIRFRDGTPQPPGDRPDELSVWALFNGIGRLVMKDPAPYLSPLPQPVSITLRTSEFDTRPAGGLTISLKEPSQRGISFEIVDLPPIGSVRILRRFPDNAALLHLAPDHQAAVRWLARHPVMTAIFDPVTADDIAAAAVEGRGLAP